MEEPFFVTYANDPVIDHYPKYADIFINHDVPSPWGFNYKSGKLHRPLHLDSDKIEKQRNLLFQEVLVKIVNGASLREIASFNKIIEEVNKTKPIVTYELTTDVNGNEKFTRSEVIRYLEKKTGGEHLYNLACHALISFLSVKGNRQRIKLCPYCKLFFIAKDAKRITCYENKCVKVDRRVRKQKQRDEHPEKYI